MAFKVGKYYRHAGGVKMHILCAVKTWMYGWSMVSETKNGVLRPVGIGHGYDTNWEEISREEWEDEDEGKIRTEVQMQADPAGS